MNEQRQHDDQRSNSKPKACQNSPDGQPDSPARRAFVKASTAAALASTTPAWVLAGDEHGESDHDQESAAYTSLDEEFDSQSAIQAKVESRVPPGVFEAAHAKQKAGGFQRVEEWRSEVFTGFSFEVKKGQSFRFEQTEGPQVVDIMLLSAARPTEEYFSQYVSMSLAGLAPTLGYNFMSNGRFFRPMATCIRDTVDYERLETVMGEGARHMFVMPTGRCDEGMNEFYTAAVNTCTCSNNFLDELNRLGGEEWMRLYREPDVFCAFTPNKWELRNGDPFMRVFESEHMYRSGDYVEFLAWQDIIVVVSNCPWGGFNNLRDITQNVNWPLKMSIFDTGLDVPDVPPFESMSAIEFVKRGREGMRLFRKGEPGGEHSFAWEAEQRRSSG